MFFVDNNPLVKPMDLSTNSYMHLFTDSLCILVQHNPKFRKILIVESLIQSIDASFYYIKRGVCGNTWSVFRTAI